MLSDFLQSSSAWGVGLTMAAFALGSLINRRTGQALCNPLLLASIGLMVFLRLLDIPYEDYKASAQPVHWLLTPATVALAIPLYEQWELLKKNAAAILSGIFAGTVMSLLSLTGIALLFHLERTVAISLLPKSVTTAIAMDVAAGLGGTASVASAFVILTGITGNVTGEAICRIFHITEPIARGVALGTSSHAVGTARALQMGQTEGAISGLSIAVAGIITAVLAPLAVTLLP